MDGNKSNYSLYISFFAKALFISPEKLCYLCLRLEHRKWLKNDHIMFPSYTIKAADAFMKADCCVTSILEKFISISHRLKAWIRVVEEYSFDHNLSLMTSIYS